jgi:membrane-associated phospholipid phosphatase
MLTQIEQIDQYCFHYVNQVWRNDFFDLVLPYFREPKTWIPLYLFLLYYIYKKFGKTAWKIILLVALSAIISDVTSSRIIKPIVHRLRPCNEPLLKKEVVNIVPCGSGFSFTSSHAANHFAVAISLVLLVFSDKKNVKYALLFWAFMVSFSQVYVGVHYPIDVLSGAILGGFIAWFIDKASRKRRFLV